MKFLLSLALLISSGLAFGSNDPKGLDDCFRLEMITTLSQPAVVCLDCSLTPKIQDQMTLRWDSGLPFPFMTLMIPRATSY